jgi:hypothetical protein
MNVNVISVDVIKAGEKHINQLSQKNILIPNVAEKNILILVEEKKKI